MAPTVASSRSGTDRLVESDPSHGPVVRATKRLHLKIGLQFSKVLPASRPALRISPRSRWNRFGADRAINASMYAPVGFPSGQAPAQEIAGRRDALQSPRRFAFRRRCRIRLISSIVVEQWNGANDFVFFARRGELASNRREDHEVSMLALHLLQNCMIYVNTLMLQQVLAQPHWRQKLEPRDLSALTPLIWEHVNPYGRFELDMNARIPLD